MLAFQLVEKSKCFFSTSFSLSERKMKQKKHKLRSNFCEDMPSSVLNFDEIWHTLRQNTALSVGSASANFVKENTSQSGSSALTVPQESPYSAYAIKLFYHFKSRNP